MYAAVLLVHFVPIAAESNAVGMVLSNTPALAAGTLPTTFNAGSTEDQDLPSVSGPLLSELNLHKLSV